MYQVEVVSLDRLFLDKLEYRFVFSESIAKKIDDCQSAFFSAHIERIAGSAAAAAAVATTASAAAAAAAAS